MTLDSDNTYFFLEARYFFMATCDFTEMMLWVFDQSRELGFSLTDLSRDEFTDNVFVKIAEKRRYKHATNIYSLPKEITLDHARLNWLSKNRHASDSATNLFYILSSKVKSLQPAEPPEPVPVAVSDQTPPSSLGQQDPKRSPDEQVAFQSWGDPERLSIEMECPPGDPRPPEVFEMVIAGTGLTADDFEAQGTIWFGRTEYLVRADVDSIARYQRARQVIKERLIEYYNRGIVRAATW